MLVEQLLEVYPRDDPRMLRMASAAMSAKRMSILFSLACVLSLILLPHNQQTALRILVSACFTGDIWYALRGWRYFQAYQELRQENRLDSKLLRTLGIDWGVRFIVPLGVCIIMGSVLTYILKM